MTQGKPEEASSWQPTRVERALLSKAFQHKSEPRNRLRPAALSPRAVAPQTGATLLFYWLGEQRSFLWAVTPQKIELFPLPAQREISQLVERYSKALLGTQDPVQADNQDGQVLFQTLVAPALKLMGTNPRVVILADGALTRLNFETLLAPGPSPPSGSGNIDGERNGAPAHYWTRRCDSRSPAPSVAMLAAAKPPEDLQKLAPRLAIPFRRS